MTQVVGFLQAAGPVTKARRDQSTYVLNEVVIDGQTYVARKDVCVLAQSMLGQQVSAVVRSEVKGNYTNFYLDFIELAGGGSQPGQGQYTPAAQAQQAQQQGQPLPAPQQQVQPQQLAPATFTPAPGPDPSPGARSAAEEAKQLSIHRQTAGKVAGLISSNPIDFWQNVQQLVVFFDTGQVPFLGMAAQQPVAQMQEAPRPQTQNAGAYQQFERDTQIQTQPQPQGNQFVPAAAYADPGPAAPPHTDDDIPF